MNVFTRFFIYISIICAATILFSLLRGDWGYGFFPFFASLSGIGVAKVFLRCKPSQYLNSTSQP
jgi:vacuolar-type H+-ATPase subunit I/STV1